jgi:hypothetical protein
MPEIPEIRECHPKGLYALAQGGESRRQRGKFRAAAKRIDQRDMWHPPSEVRIVFSPNGLNPGPEIDGRDENDSGFMRFHAHATPPYGWFRAAP